MTSLTNLLKNKNLLIGICAVVILGLGYYFWSSNSSQPLLTSGTTSPGSQQILATLGRLHTIKLDPSLFTDSVFVSLNDFGVTIPPQTAGRRNPFAAVGQ